MSKSIECNNPAALRAYLADKADHTPGPNGQSTFRFANGLVVLVYDTRSVVIQGKLGTEEQEKVENVVIALNA